MRLLLPMAWVVFVCLAPSPSWSQGQFIRGDCNQNGVLNFTDVLAIAQSAILEFHPCRAACDFDDVDNSMLIDAIMLLEFLFMDGPSPAPPYPVCGVDPTPSSFPGCSVDQCDVDLGTPDSRYLLHIDDLVVSGNNEVEVVVLLDNESFLSAWSFGVCHDDSVATVVSVVQGPDSVAAGEDPLFVVTQLESSGWNHVFLRDLPFASLPAGVDHRVAVATYDPIGALGDSTPLSFCETLATPVPVENRVTEFFDDVIPIVADGSLSIEEVFIRGDVNGDGVGAGLTDALYALNFGFLGGPPPVCNDAGDFDDNGMFSSIQDALGILNYSFLGAAPPPPPGIECGPDPTPDALDCQNTGTCP